LLGLLPVFGRLAEVLATVSATTPPMPPTTARTIFMASNVFATVQPIAGGVPDGAVLGAGVAGGVCSGGRPTAVHSRAKARACNRRILQADVSVRAASSRVQPLSGSRTPP
ncbi:MAG: hypothetical protein ACJ780_13435, partial [Solirubrobacteraceae bacterium]